MTSGIPAQLCVWIVWILLITGWLPQVHEAFRLENAMELRKWLLSWGLVFPLEVQITPKIHVHLSWLWLVAGFLVLLAKSDRCVWGKLLTGMGTTGVVLFLIREWFWTRPSAQGGWVYGIMFGLLCFLLLSGHKSWFDRTMAVWGGLLLAEGIWLTIHRQMFCPLEIGDGAWMDTIVLFLTGWVLVHTCWKSAVDRFRVRSFRTER